MEGAPHTANNCWCVCSSGALPHIYRLKGRRGNQGGAPSSAFRIPGATPKFKIIELLWLSEGDKHYKKIHFRDDTCLSQ